MPLRVVPDRAIAGAIATLEIGSGRQVMPVQQRMKGRAAVCDAEPLVDERRRCQRKARYLDQHGDREQGHRQQQLRRPVCEPSRRSDGSCR